MWVNVSCVFTLNFETVSRTAIKEEEINNWRNHFTLLMKIEINVKKKMLEQGQET